MKQLLICGDKAYATSTAKYNDLTTVPEGTLAFFSLVDGTLLTKTPKSNFAIVLGRGTDKMPIVIPEVDVKTLQVHTSSYKAASKFAATITVPTTEVGRDYTVVVVKQGTVFNERSNWTFTERATSTTAADVAKKIVAQINANKYNLGCTATNTGGAITIKAVEAGKGYVVLGADGLHGVVPTSVTEGIAGFGDKKYMQDLASKCAAGKGFNDTYADGESIYPGYPEEIAHDKYAICTLRFAVPRVSAKQRDEVVYQVVHIAIPPEGANSESLATAIEDVLSAFIPEAQETTTSGGGSGSDTPT